MYGVARYWVELGSFAWHLASLSLTRQVGRRLPSMIRDVTRMHMMMRSNKALCQDLKIKDNSADVRMS